MSLPSTTMSIAGAVCIGGVVIGALTSIGQQALPAELKSIANSAGSWSLAAFAFGLLNQSPRRGIALGTLALLAMLLGYIGASELRGYASGLRLVAFWGVASVIVGPVLGVGAAWVRGGEPLRASTSAGVIGGILIGEGVYGLTVVAGTTTAAYWIGQAVVGVALVLGVTLTRAGPWRSGAVGGGTAALVATAFWFAYSADTIAILG